MGFCSPLPRLNSYSHAHSSHSHLISIPMADRIPIPMGIPWNPWDPRPLGSYAHLYFVADFVFDRRPASFAKQTNRAFEPPLEDTKGNVRNTYIHASSVPH